MKRYYRIITTIIIATIFVFPALANKVEQGFRGIGGEFGVVYECAFPNTVELDGKVEELAWQYAAWHFVDNKTGTAPAPSENNASYAFAVVADDKWLYVAFKIKDDKIQSGENVGGDVWQDDSVEVYIDPNYGQTQTYETVDGNWDSQITIGADNIGGVIDKPLLGGGGDGPGTGTKAAVVKVTGGWNVEAAVPLKAQGKWDIKPKDGMVIGFNTHFNDDDDGGGEGV